LRQGLSHKTPVYGLILACIAFVFPLFLHAQVNPLDSIPRRDSLGKDAMKEEPVDTAVMFHVIEGDTVAAVETDTTRPDTGKSKFKPFRNGIHLSPPKEHYNPRIALGRSLLLPGWGQLYNNRWWKVPIIYAGFGTFAAFIIGNNQGYLDYDRAVKCKGDPTCTDDPYPDYNIEGVIAIREEYRRYRDLSIILGGLWYVLQAVDSYVDAHLREFNVSEDLQAQLHPSLYIDPFRRNSLYTGVSLTLKLRR
jgi:hypothetical protein